MQTDEAGGAVAVPHPIPLRVSLTLQLRAWPQGQEAAEGQEGAGSPDPAGVALGQTGSDKLQARLHAQGSALVPPGTGSPLPPGSLWLVA